MSCSEPRVSRPSSAVSESSACPSASRPTTAASSVEPVSPPGSSRKRAGSSGRTTNISVSSRPDEAATLPASSPGSVRTSVVSGTSG